MLIFFLIGILAGLVEASAGGSGLISLPAIMIFGYQPIEALATSKFQYAFGAATAIFRFSRAGLIHWGRITPLLIGSVGAGGLGAYLLSKTNPEIIAVITPILLVVVAVYFARGSSISDQATRARISWNKFAIFAVPPIAFYDGFFGVGSASLYLAAFIYLLGMNARTATANTKLIDFASGVSALVVLAAKGHVLLLPGLMLGAGQIIGSYLGASLVVKWGARWVRPLVVLVSIALSLDLLIRHWDRLSTLTGPVQTPGLGRH